MYVHPQEILRSRRHSGSDASSRTYSSSRSGRTVPELNTSVVDLWTGANHQRTICCVCYLLTFHHGSLACRCSLVSEWSQATVGVVKFTPTVARVPVSMHDSVLSLHTAYISPHLVPVGSSLPVVHRYRSIVRSPVWLKH